MVLDEVVCFAAAADNPGWWPSEFGSSSLLGHSLSEGVPRLSCASGPQTLRRLGGLGYSGVVVNPDVRWY